MLAVSIFLAAAVTASAHAHEGGQSKAASCAVCGQLGATAETPLVPVVPIAHSVSDLAEADLAPQIHDRWSVRLTRARAPPF